MSEKDFFDRVRKEMVEEVEEGEVAVEEGGSGGQAGALENGNGQRGLEDREGEVDERRLKEVLGRDLSGGGGVM